MNCHRLVRHRAMRALIYKIRKAQAAGDTFGVYMLRQRLDHELAS